MQRLLTGVLGGAFVVAAMFLLAPPWFLSVVIAAMLVAVREFLRVACHHAPRMPGSVLYATVPLQAVLVYLSAADEPGVPAFWAEAVALGLPLVFGTLVLLRRLPMEQTLTAAGVLSFGSVYFGLAAGAIGCVQRLDPWLCFLLAAVVWLGDTGALYGGRYFGRHKLAPVVSPNKTWEGAAAGLATSVLSAAVYSLVRLGRLEPRVLALAAAVALAAQVGDLVESMFKRGAGVKDSGQLLPGHGGMLDRVDSLLFGAPALWFGIRVLGPRWFLP